MPARPLILFYTSFFGRPPDTDGIACREDCEFTTDRRRLREADAVIFHLPSPGKLRRAKKYPGQLWVAWSMESRVSCPFLADADAMRHFDVVMTYEQSADIWCPYLPAARDIDAALSRPLPAKSEAAPAVLVQSASYDRSGRNEFARNLMKFMRVDSYGKFLNTRRLDGPDEGRATKLALIAPYRFCLAFENSIAPDYVTEKFFDPLLAGTVPVYRGAPNVEDFAPRDGCFIDASRLKPRELAEYLNHLSGDEDAYQRFFAWRSAALRPGFVTHLERCAHQPFCLLCELVLVRIGGWCVIC